MLYVYTDIKMITGTETLLVFGVFFVVVVLIYYWKYEVTAKDLQRSVSV